MSYPSTSLPALPPTNRFAALPSGQNQILPPPPPTKVANAPTSGNSPTMPTMALKPASGDTATFGGWVQISEASQQTFKAFLEHPTTQLGGGMLLKTGVPLALVVLGMPLKIFPLNELFTLAAVGISHQSGKLGSSLLEPLQGSHFKDALSKRLLEASKEDIRHLMAAPGTPESVGRFGQTKFQNLLSSINLLTQKLLKAMPIPPEAVRFAKGFVANLDIGPHNLGWLEHLPLVGGSIKNGLTSYAGFRTKLIATEGHDELLRLMRKGVYKKFLRLAEPKNNKAVDFARQMMSAGMWNTRSILDAAHAPTMRAAYGTWWKNFTTELSTMLTAKSLEKVVEVVARRLPPFIGTPLLWVAKLADGLMKVVFNTK